MMCIYTHLSLSLSLYVYIYIYIHSGDQKGKICALTLRRHARLLDN